MMAVMGDKNEHIIFKFSSVSFHQRTETANNASYFNLFMQTNFLANQLRVFNYLFIYMQCTLQQAKHILKILRQNGIISSVAFFSRQHWCLATLFLSVWTGTYLILWMHVLHNIRVHHPRTLKDSYRPIPIQCLVTWHVYYFR